MMRNRMYDNVMPTDGTDHVLPYEIGWQFCCLASLLHCFIASMLQPGSCIIPSLSPLYSLAAPTRGWTEQHGRHGMLIGFLQRTAGHRLRRCQSTCHDNHLFVIKSSS